MELKNILCIFIIVFSSFYSQAQSDYREGFIITSNKDTIHGLIDFRDGSKNYKICNFKNNNNSKPVSYSPTDLTGYGFINDKFFLSKKLENNNVSEKAFLEVLITGAATLYRYQKIFYIEKDSFFYELTNEKQYKTIDGKKVLVESKQYISILRFLLHDCGSFIEKISNSKYSEKSLTHLIDTYNTCVGTSGITYKSQKPWVKSIVGISGGFKISRLNFFTNYTMHEHINHTRDRIITPIWGLTLNIFSPRISERISFHNDFYYLTTTYYMDKSTDLGYRKRNDLVKIHLGQLSIATGLRYTGPEKSITPYFNFGMLNVFHINSNSEWTRKTDDNSYLINKQALVIKGKQTGLWGGVGIIKSISPKLKFLVDARYEWTDGLSNYPRTGLKSAISNLQFTAGIRIK